MTVPAPSPADFPPAPALVAALYRFARFDDPEGLRAPLHDLCAVQGVRGTLLLATEGINGTIAGPEAGIAAVIAHIRALPGCSGLDVKYASAPAIPFGRLKVKVKAEIVTLGVGDLDPAANAGTHVAPRNWNALIADPETVVIDTRNSYEVDIGSFEGAIDPDTQGFRDFPARFDAMAAQWAQEGRTPRIAMFCTGGIRCEKSTAYARSRGFGEVYHLEGGILRYLEEVAEDESLWRGECFVFDERVAVGPGLALGTYVSCEACGVPVARSAFADHHCSASAPDGVD
ncbi:MAG: hypothetical protein DI547_10855 [Sphingobium sp.]|nr:MAG: hypothetical protein DI547_10855 [Sphingobium sp.]